MPPYPQPSPLPLQRQLSSVSLLALGHFWPLHRLPSTADAWWPNHCLILSTILTTAVQHPMWPFLNMSLLDTRASICPLFCTIVQVIELLFYHDGLTSKVNLVFLLPSLNFMAISSSLLLDRLWPSFLRLHPILTVFFSVVHPS